MDSPFPSIKNTFGLSGHIFFQKYNDYKENSVAFFTPVLEDSHVVSAEKIQGNCLRGYCNWTNRFVYLNFLFLLEVGVGFTETSPGIVCKNKYQEGN